MCVNSRSNLRVIKLENEHELVVKHELLVSQPLNESEPSILVLHTLY